MTSHATQLSKFRESADASVAQCERVEAAIEQIESEPEGESILADCKALAKLAEAMS